MVSKHRAYSDISTLALHDALPISNQTLLEVKTTELSFADSSIVQEGDFILEEVPKKIRSAIFENTEVGVYEKRSEEHTSELQSPCNLVCRLLLEKKKQI